MRSGGRLAADVRFHATLRQAVGGKYVDVEWSDGLTVWGFVAQMVERYQRLARSASTARASWRGMST